MTTSLVRENNNEEINEIMKKKLNLKLKTDDNSIYFYINNYIRKRENELNDENKIINRICYLFPSIPRQRIENLVKANKEMSIEEGIEKLNELTLTENNKNKPNKNEQINLGYNNNNNAQDLKNDKKFRKIIINKRNYNTMISQSNQIGNANNTYANNMTKNNVIMNQQHQ